MSSENSKTSDPHRLSLNRSDKLKLKRSDKYDALSNLSIYCTRKNIKSQRKTINSKYQLQYGTKNLNYQMDHFLYWGLKISLSISSKNTIEQWLIILQ